VHARTGSGTQAQREATARAATTATARKAARELQEEREHVELVHAWMKKVPKPDVDWVNDPDPPAYAD
jgi:hypothetical protein